jgi:quercetin dioxygenase-like cupin family protein
MGQCRAADGSTDWGHMSHIQFRQEDAENLVAGHYSTGRGQVLRSDTIELTKIAYKQGFGADTHQHPEEQVLYVLEGCLRFTCGDETYDVRPGEGSFHSSNVPHSVVAIEDTVALSFKNQVAPNYEATGRLGG